MRNLKRALSVLSAATLVIVALSACGTGGGDDQPTNSSAIVNNDTSGSQSDASLTSTDGTAENSSDSQGAPRTVTMAKASDINANTLNDVVGLVDNGKQFGIDTTLADITTFSDASIALQMVLAGKVDFAAVAPSDAITAISEGVPIQFFCTKAAGWDMRIVGTGDVTSLDYLLAHEDTVPVAVESPGGPTNMLFNLAVIGKGHPDFTVQQFKNQKVLNDSGLRTSALVNGTVNVANINYYQLASVEQALGKENVHVLSVVMDDVPQGTISHGLAARTDWLDNNTDLAAEACASIVRGNQRLSEDFNYYKEQADLYISPKIDDETLKTTWETISKRKLFPYEPPLLAPESMDAIIGILKRVDLISSDSALTYEDVVNTKVLAATNKLLGY